MSESQDIQSSSVEPDEDAIREFIESYRQETGRRPSPEEIGLYFATRSNQSIVARLEEEGLLERGPGGITFTRAAMKALRERL